MDYEIRQKAALEIQVLYELGLSCETIAWFLKVTRMTIHRWLGAVETGFCLPERRSVEAIDSLVDLVKHIRGDWTDVITSWNGRYHRSTRLTLYAKPAHRILRSKDLERGEKVVRLTALTFNSWAADERKKLKGDK